MHRPETGAGRCSTGRWMTRRSSGRRSFDKARKARAARIAADGSPGFRRLQTPALRYCARKDLGLSQGLTTSSRGARNPTQTTPRVGASPTSPGMLAWSRTCLSREDDKRSSPGSGMPDSAALWPWTETTVGRAWNRGIRRTGARSSTLHRRTPWASDSCDDVRPPKP